MKVYIENKDKITSYQWGYDEEIKRYFVKLNFDLPSDTEVKVLSLADHTKQVRKEVCEEIRNLIKDNSFLANEMLTGERLEVLSKYKMLDILIRVEDQIQGEKE